MCNHEKSKIIDVRNVRFRGKWCIRRRRDCCSCTYSFTTYEIENETLDGICKEMLYILRDLCDKRLAKIGNIK